MTFSITGCERFSIDAVAVADVASVVAAGAAVAVEVAAAVTSASLITLFPKIVNDNTSCKYRCISGSAKHRMFSTTIHRVVLQYSMLSAKLNRRRDGIARNNIAMEVLCIFVGLRQCTSRMSSVCVSSANPVFIFISLKQFVSCPTITIVVGSNSLSINIK